MMKEFVAKPYPVVNYTAEQSEEISSLTVDIYKYVNETWASWIVNGGIDEQWDAYVDQLNQGPGAFNGDLSGSSGCLQ